MDIRYTTLKTLFDLVKEETRPTASYCSFNQVLVHGKETWDTLLEHLNQLQQEGLVSMRQGQSLEVSITEEGVKQISSLELIHLL